MTYLHHQNLHHLQKAIATFQGAIPPQPWPMRNTGLRYPAKAVVVVGVIVTKKGLSYPQIGGGATLGFATDGHPFF